MTDYLKLYAAKVKEHSLNGQHLNEIIRYLLVNGHIPATKEHLEMMGSRTFYLGADHLPENTAKLLLELAKKLEHQEDEEDEVWQYDEESTVDVLETLSYELEGVWLEGGVKGMKVVVRKKVIVDQTYHVSAEVSLDELLLPEEGDNE